ncbi:MAG: septum site-determining protein MinC [Firmicutes bacterium]|nr:septum site-determining protein MinC [Bacillota bacterium]
MQIKGDRRGLKVLAHGFDSVDALINDLQQTLERRAAFLKNSELLIEVSQLNLTADLFSQISQVFAAYPQLILRGIVLEDGTKAPIPLERSNDTLDTPLLLRQTIRSGQVISHRGDIIIIGDVNPGATITSSGDIMVLGGLRGTAQAGQGGGRHHGIYALMLQPAQLKIADIIAVGDGDGLHPEYAHLENNTMIVDPWHDIHLPESITAESHGRLADRLSGFHR